MKLFMACFAILMMLAIATVDTRAQVGGKWVKLLRVPYAFLAPLILTFVIIGAYSVNNSIFDVGITIAFGFFGYLMRKFDFEPAPLVLAMILGPQLEASLRRSLIYSRGDLGVFFERPIAAVLLALALLMLLSPLLRSLLSHKVWESIKTRARAGSIRR